MAHDNSTAKSVGLGEALLDHLAIILALGLVGVVGGFLLSQKTETTVDATTSILITPLEGNPFYPSNRGEDLLNLNSEAQALRSDQVAAIAARKLGLASSPNNLLSKLTVSVPVNTQILDVTYTARNPDKAITYSQAFADSYLVFRKQQAENRIEVQVAELDSETEANNRTLDELALRLSEPGASAVQQAAVRQQMDSLTSQNANLSAKRTELTTTPLNPGQVVTPAEIQASGLVSMKLLLLIAGLLGGLSIGVGIALVRTRSDIRIQTATDVTAAGLSVLGVLGDLPPSAPDAGAIFEEHVEDEYRRLRVAIMATVKSRKTSILIASATSDSRAPVSVSDLAVSLARSGTETLIIDSTGSGLGPSFILGNEARTGLADVITRRATFEESIAYIAPLLWVLGPGDPDSDTADLVTGDEMARVMALASDRADVILIAADSFQSGIAQSLGSAAAHVALEVDQALTTSVELDRASRVLDMLPSSPLGAIFVSTKARVRTTPFTPQITANRGQLPRPSPAELPRVPGPLEEGDGIDGDLGNGPDETALDDAGDNRPAPSESRSQKSAQPPGSGTVQRRPNRPPPSKKKSPPPRSRDQGPKQDSGPNQSRVRTDMPNQRTGTD